MIRLTSGTVSGTGAVQIGLRQRRLLIEPVTFEERPISDLVRIVVFGTALVVAAFIWWCSMTPVEQTVSVAGHVVPAGQIKTIRRPDGGVVSDIVVHDGDRVHAGQVLVRLDPAAAKAELDQALAQSAELQMRIERLRALAEGREPNFGALSAQWPDLAADQRRIWLSQRDSRRAALAVIDSQTEQHRKEASQLRAALAVARRQLDIAGRRLSIRQQRAPDVPNGAESQLDAQSAQLMARGEVDRLRDQILVAVQSVVESQRQRVNQDLMQREEALTEAGAAAADLEPVKATIAKLRDRIGHLDVHSPIDGIVQDMRVHGPGDVVPADGPLLSVAPADGPLQIDVRIPARDIGRVRMQQPVRIKMAGYDDARYGSLTGHLTRLAPTTFADAQGRTYYDGVIGLDQTAIGPEQRPVLPGMAVEADIVAGTGTLAGYLFRPLAMSVDTAFHEP